MNERDIMVDDLADPVDRVDDRRTGGFRWSSRRLSSRP